MFRHETRVLRAYRRLYLSWYCLKYSSLASNDLHLHRLSSTPDLFNEEHIQTKMTVELHKMNSPKGEAPNANLVIYLI